MPDYQLNFPINVGDAGQLRQLVEIVSKIGSGTTSASKSLADLGGILKSLIPQSAATALGIAGVGSAAVTAAEKLFSLARVTGQLAEAQSNAAIRAGVSVREYGILAAVADEAGVSTQAFTTSMRTLSKALSDNSSEGKLAKSALSELGITARNQFGAVVPLKDFYIQLGQSLDKVQDPAKKADLVIRTLGRGGLELLPILTSELKDNFSALEKLGVGFDEKGAASAKRFDDALDRLSTRLKTLKREIGETVATGLGFGDDAEKKRVGGMLARPDLQYGFVKSYDVRSGTYSYVDPESKKSYSTLSEALASRPLLTAADVLRQVFPGTTSKDLAAQQSAASRTAVDALLQSGGPGGRISGLRYQLSDAQGDLAAAREAGNVKGVTASLGRIEALKKEIEAYEKAKGVTERLTGVIERLNERALIPLAELIQKTSSELEKIARTGRPMSQSEMAAVNQAFRGAILRDPRFRPDVPTDNPDAARFQYGFLPGVAQMQQSDMAYSDTARQRVVAARIAGIQGYAGYQAQVAQLTAGPGGEVAAIQQAAAIRIKAARDEYDITRDRLKLSQDIIDVERQGRIQILQLQKQQRDEYVNAVKGGFQALISGGSGGLQAFIKAQGVGLASTVVGNLAGMTYRSGMLSLPGTGTADNPTFLGKLLSGTPFGPKLGPEEKMMTAADMQLRAAQIFAGAVTGGGVGGLSLAGIMPSGGTLGSLAGMLGPGGTSGFAGPLKGFGGLSLSSMDRSISIPGLPTTTLSAMLGGGLAAGQGVWSAINGLHGGGTRGGLQAAGGIATAAGGILPLLSSSLSFLGPWGMAAGGALQLASMLFGDPKQNRQNSINRVLRGAAFYDPIAINETIGANGMYADYDRYGNVRGSSLSPVPDILEPYSDWRRGVQVQGATGAQFGGSGPNTKSITVNVNAMDSKSFSDHAEDIASAVGLAIKQGRAGTLPDALQNM